MEYINEGRVSSTQYDFISADSSIWTSHHNYTCDTTVNTSTASPEIINTTEIIPNMASWLNLSTGARTSGIYILTLYRNPSVEAVYVETSISDANGSAILPQAKVWIGDKTPADTSAWQRRVERGKIADPRLLVPVTRYRRGYRRKGKSSGGGAKSGPSSSGFSSSKGVGGRSYGYSSSTTKTRFVGGTFNRRPYGLTGRTMVVGSTFFMLFSMRANGYGHRYCSRYSSSERLSCQNRYSNNCTLVNAVESQCIGMTSTDVIRDDIMSTAFDAQGIKFPLTLTISRLAVVLKSGVNQLEDWDKPVFYGFSEVDVDPPSEEQDVAAALIVLGVVLGLAFCCSAGACFFSYMRNQPTTARRVTPEVDMRRLSRSGLYSSRRTTRHDREDHHANFERPVVHPPNGHIQDPAPPKYQVTGPPSPTSAHMMSAVPMASSESHQLQFMSGTLPKLLPGYSPPLDNSKDSTHALPPDWQMVTEIDPVTRVWTGRVYYHNMVTNETSWACPRLL